MPPPSSGEKGKGKGRGKKGREEGRREEEKGEGKGKSEEGRREGEKGRKRSNGRVGKVIKLWTTLYTPVYRRDVISFSDFVIQFSMC